MTYIIRIAGTILFGFGLHRLRPITLRYHRRTGDLVRSAIGSAGIIIAAGVGMFVERVRRPVGALKILCESVGALGLGVVLAYFWTGED